MYATGDVVRIHPDGLRRVRRPSRQPGQDPRPPHRARRDRGGARPPPRRRPVGRRGREATATPALVAFVVADAATDGVTDDELRKHVGEHRCPTRWCRRWSPASTPSRSRPNGKIDRKALPADGRRRMRRIARRSDAAPADDTERLVAGHLEPPSSSAPSGRDDNFFDIGGHSLLAVKVFRRLADATGRRSRSPTSSGSRRCARSPRSSPHCRTTVAATRPPFPLRPPAPIVRLDAASESRDNRHPTGPDRGTRRWGALSGRRSHRRGPGSVRSAPLRRCAATRRCPWGG